MGCGAKPCVFVERGALYPERNASFASPRERLPQRCAKRTAAVVLREAWHGGLRYVGVRKIGKYRFRWFFTGDFGLPGGKKRVMMIEYTNMTVY